MYIVFFEYGNGASYDREFETREEADYFVKELWENDDIYTVSVFEESELIEE